MTWEIVTLLSVLIVCGTAYFTVIHLFIDYSSDAQSVTLEEFDELKALVETFKAEQEAVHKLAEETKKLLSNQNLAQSLRSR